MTLSKITSVLLDAREVKITFITIGIKHCKKCGIKGTAAFSGNILKCFSKTSE